jgi:hypothetical protein
MPDAKPSERTPRPDRPKAERRRHPRAMTSFAATVVGASGQWTAKVINLSMGGALLDLGKTGTSAPLAIGERVTVTIESKRGTGPVTLGGAAVHWNRTVAPHPLLAIQFDQVDDDDNDTLDDLMSEAMAQILGRNQQ